MAAPFKQAWIILKGQPTQCPNCGGEAQRINEADLADPDTLSELDKHGVDPHNAHSIVCRECGYDEFDDLSGF